jgi:hypothetical protein
MDPGAALATYLCRSWLRADFVAGITLAAYLCRPGSEMRTRVLVPR